MSALVLCIAIVGGGTLASVLGMLLVRKNVDLASLQSHHEVASSLLSVLGTLYAVVLGFVVVDASQGIDKARLLVETEGNSVADVFRLAEGLPNSSRGPIQKACEVYVKTVVENEWEHMDRRENFSAGWDAMTNLWDCVRGYNPQQPNEQAIYAEMLNSVGSLGDCRRARMVGSQSNISSVLWVVLIVGGLSTTIFTYFFGLRNVRTQALMTVLVAVTLSLNIFLIAVFSSPYVGDFKVSPQAFLLDSDLFNRITNMRHARVHAKESDALRPLPPAGR